MPKRFLPAALALLLAIAAAGCGGGDDSGSSSTPSGGTPAATATIPATQTGRTTTAASPSPAATGAADLPAELQRAAREAANARYTANYTITQEGQQSEAVIAQDPPKFYLSGTVEGSTFILISDGTATYTCFKTGATGTCFKGEAVPGTSFLNPGEIVDSVDTASSYKKLDDRKIAGVDSTCWEVTVTDLQGTATMCIGKSIPVVTYVEGSGLKMELKSLSQGVDGKLFEPPFPVQ